jgi:hypothetical protein
LKANKVNLSVSSVLFFLYHSSNFLDTPRILYHEMHLLENTLIEIYVHPLLKNDSTIIVRIRCLDLPACIPCTYSYTARLNYLNVISRVTGLTFSVAVKVRAFVPVLRTSEILKFGKTSYSDALQ